MTYANKVINNMLIILAIQIIFRIFTPSTQTHNTMNQTIQIQDILDVLEHNSIPIEKQIEVLEILSLALYTRDHADDPSGILDHKIQLLRQLIEDAKPESADTAGADQSLSLRCTEPVEATKGDTACIKVKAITILLLLEKLQISRANHDLTKICRLIAFLTDNSYRKIYAELQKGIILSEYHTQQIQQINKILTELNLETTIQPNKEY